MMKEYTQCSITFEMKIIKLRYKLPCLYLKEKSIRNIPVKQIENDIFVF